MEQQGNQQSYSQPYPIYTLRPSVMGVMLPKFILMLLLGGLLYYGGYLNLKFLNIRLTTLFKLSIIVCTFLVVAFALLMEYKKAIRIDFYFYSDRLYANGKWVMYSSIGHIDAKRGPMDHLAKTCSIHLGDQAVLKKVPDSFNIYQYIQNLVSRAKQQ
ncbi:hypothetical protein J4227_05710 [Candidatus Woesearchaeota archaeon]|nr:hypothetical protein [Candidatus Woesearchaeota archaeon]